LSWIYEIWFWNVDLSYDYEMMIEIWFDELCDVMFEDMWIEMRWIAYVIACVDEILWKSMNWDEMHVWSGAEPLRGSTRIMRTWTLNDKSWSWVIASRTRVRPESWCSWGQNKCKARELMLLVSKIVRPVSWWSWR
jgi:hypothetical protein